MQTTHIKTQNIQILLSWQLPISLQGQSFSPATLDAIGNLELLKKPCIAIVGSRDSSQDAVQFTQQIAAHASEQGICVVSGGARGIDTAAHQGALGYAGSTIAVLGVSLYQSIPKFQRPLLDAILSQGGLILSELPKDAPYYAKNYTQRNRLIAGLGQVCVVVQAQTQSGALSTTQWCKKWPRPIWAISASPWDQRSSGNRLLIQQGAHMIDSLLTFNQMLAQNFNVISTATNKIGSQKTQSKRQDPILKLLQLCARSFDELQSITQTNPAILAKELLEHELNGCIEHSTDGLYRIK